MNVRINIGGIKQVFLDAILSLLCLIAMLCFIFGALACFVICLPFIVLLGAIAFVGWLWEKIGSKE